MTKKEAADFLKCSVKTLDRRAADPENGLRYIPDGSRMLILVADVEAYHMRRLEDAGVLPKPEPQAA